MNCHICGKYCNCKESVCNLRIKTMPNRDPNDTRFWSIDPAPKDMDPVVNNAVEDGFVIMNLVKQAIIRFVVVLL